MWLYLNSLRTAALRQLHSRHPGISCMKAIVCSTVYWSNLDREIESKVKGCTRFMEVQKNPPQLDDSHWPDPERPWSQIHIDFVGLINSLNFLVVVDKYSKWPEIFTMNATITVLRRLFSQHGLPETLVSQIMGHSSHQICSNISARRTVLHMSNHHLTTHSQIDEQNILLIHSSAPYCMWGGDSRGDITNLTYHSTPNVSVKERKTPAEALMGWKLCTTLDALHPQQKQVQGQQLQKTLQIHTPVFARNY